MAQGGPLGPLPPTYQAPIIYTISGEVYSQSTQNGNTIDTGVGGVTMYLAEYSTSAPQTLIGWYTTTTSSSGTYDFGNVLNQGSPNQYLTPSGSDFYTIMEVPPLGDTAVSASAGNFLSSSGSPLTAPQGVYGVPANGAVDAPYADNSHIDYMVLPPATGSFAPNSKGGKYADVNNNFQLSALTASGSLSTTLSLAGTNNRFLVGSGSLA